MSANVIPLRKAVRVGDGDIPESSQYALAERFADKHMHEMQYVDERGQWALWDGKCWRLKRHSSAFARVREVCAEAAEETKDLQVKRSLLHTNTMLGVERQARVEPRLLSHTDVWDADPWLLNTPDGVVDLRTGKMLRHDPKYRMTRITAVGPREMLTPNWDRFLATSTSPQIEVFLQRFAGYALTGVTVEHALLFLFGLGGNGKSVFLSAISGAMGDYHVAAAMQTFVESRFDRHTTELASLAGARLVTASETERGRRWAEARLKALTGGDPVTARFMRQDDFTYTLQFKLVFSGNHKPEMRGVDEAMRRRFHLVPFDVTIPRDKRDPNLLDKLKGEWPGIMLWMIGGCLRWQMKGLCPPKVVRDATEEYLSSQDHYKQWLASCIKLNGSWRDRTELFESWKEWAFRNNMPAGNNSELYDYIRSLEGVTEVKRDGYPGFKGLIRGEIKMK